MIWKNCRLLAKRKVGEDALKNPIYEYAQVAETVARHTPWTEDQIVLEGREVTKNEQRFILPIPFSVFPDCHKAIIDEKEQEITQVIDLSPRYTVIQVKKYGGK